LFLKNPPFSSVYTVLHSKYQFVTEYKQSNLKSAKHNLYQKNNSFTAPLIRNLATKRHQKNRLSEKKKKKQTNKDPTRTDPNDQKR
jgi:hypothetical protein